MKQIRIPLIVISFLVLFFLLSSLNSSSVTLNCKRTNNKCSYTHKSGLFKGEKKIDIKISEIVGVNLKSNQSTLNTSKTRRQKNTQIVLKTDNLELPLAPNRIKQKKAEKIKIVVENFLDDSSSEFLAIKVSKSGRIKVI